MFIKEYGRGPRVFFGLHGWSGDHSTFAPLVNYMPAEATFASADLPGYGQSAGTADLTLAGLAGVVADAMERIERPTFALVGNCSGALVGLTALELRPSLVGRVERLVLIAPVAYTPWNFRFFVSPPIGRYAYYSTFANPLGRWLTNLSLRGHRAEETDLTHSFSAVDHAVSYRYLEMLTGIGSIDRWEGIRLETDLVYGARTFGAIRKSIGMWRAMWPHARLHELQTAGHLPIQEATEELSRILFR